MKSIALLLLAVAIGTIAAVPPAWAQIAPASKPASVETVTVTGQKLSPDQVTKNFVQSYAAPNAFLGRLARWKDGLCPKVFGVQPQAEDFIERRIREVAAGVGARVDPKQDCPGNVEIVFTPQPQTLLNEIRKKASYLLGYDGDSPSQADRLAVISHPIQAWYATQIEDVAGVVRRNESHEQCMARRPVECSARAVGVVAASSFGGFVDGGLKSQFSNVLVIADVNKIGGYAVGALADYASLMTLSQAQGLDSCKDLPTIANLMAKNCAPAVQASALTDTDLSYLRALYKIPPDSRAGNQEMDIEGQMEKKP
jgi:hypothetical protein